MHTISDTYSWVCLSGILEHTKCVCRLSSTKSWPKTESIIDLFIYIYYYYFSCLFFVPLSVFGNLNDLAIRMGFVFDVVHLFTFNNSTRRNGGKISSMLDQNKLLTIFRSNVSIFGCIFCSVFNGIKNWKEMKTENNINITKLK